MINLFCRKEKLYFLIQRNETIQGRENANAILNYKRKCKKFDEFFSNENTENIFFNIAKTPTYIITKK
jgi:hypothetical protein